MYEHTEAQGRAGGTGAAAGAQAWSTGDKAAIPARCLGRVYGPGHL